MSLQYYHDLASDDDEIRFRAAYGLLSDLAAENNPSGESLQYAVKRLIRGLASGRGSSRIGFSISLTELLSQLLGPNRSKVKDVDIDFDTVVEILKLSTLPVGKVSGQEQRDHYLGRLFGLKAIVTSGILFEKDSTLQQWTEVVNLLLDLAKKKPWLREECGFVIYAALHKCNEDLTQAAIERLASHGLVRTPEGVAIWLRARDKFGPTILPASIWPHQDPMHSSNHALLAQILKETTLAKEKDAVDLEGSHERGSWKSKLHFAWDGVLTKSVEMSSSSKSSKISSNGQSRFQNFWNTVVDENLFSASASEERKYWGFLVVGNAIPRLPRSLIHYVFSKNFMRCFINQLAQSNRYLHLAAQKLLKIILETAQSNGSSMGPVEVIKALTSENGSPSFDHLTKSKAVEKLLSVSNSDQLSAVLEHFQEILCNPGIDEAVGAEKVRQQLADQLIALIRHGKAAKSSPCINEVIAMQIGFGYFTTKILSRQQTIQPPFSASSQAIFRTRLTSTLTLLMSSKETMIEPWPYKAVCYIQSALDEGHQLVMELDQLVHEAQLDTSRTLKRIDRKISKAKKKKTAHLEAFRLISSIGLLLLYNGDADALSLLEELQICFNSIVDNKLGHDADTDPMVVMAEIFLSFGSKSSKLLRKVAEQVFVVFSGDMTREALHIFIEVLGTKESFAGQQDIFNVENDEGDEDDEDDSASDVELLDAPSEVEEVSSSDDESDSNSEAVDGDVAAAEDADAEAQAGLDEALAKVLGTRRGDEDLGQSDSSTDESDMDDDQMMEVDNHLVKIFTEKKKLAGKKQEKKEAKANVINLKRRVLDLLEIYLKQQHTNSLALETILPLLMLIRSTNDKGLSQKSCDVVRDFAKACKGQEVPTITDSKAGFDLLEAIHAEATKDASYAHVNACSSMSILVVKTLVAMDKKNIDGIVDLYGQTWKQWLLKKRCKVQASFFTSFVNWSTSASKQLQE